MNTSVAHNMHHKYFKGNYGLYFTIWDRFMGTLNENYDTAFDEVTTRKKIKSCKIKNSENKSETVLADNVINKHRSQITNKDR